MIPQPPVLQYYDLIEEVALETDARNYGLGAVLLQNGKPVAFASRTLTQTERSKRSPRLVLGCARYDHFLHGKAKING